MPRLRQPITVTVPTQHQLLLQEVRNGVHCIQSLDPVRRTLTALHWPINERRERVMPSSLREYRQSHQFLGPCCLCPLFMPRDRVFTEAAIFIAASGPFSGEYVAQCAKGECGYLVLLERIYPRTGVPVKMYPPRGASEEPPTQVFHHSEIELDNRLRQPTVPPARPLKRTYPFADLTNGTTAMPQRGVRHSNRRTDWRRFQELDSMVRPGLSEREFRNLFAKCGTCGLITTHQVFSFHNCWSRAVDLTDEAEE